MECKLEGYPRCPICWTPCSAVKEAAQSMVKDGTRCTTLACHELRRRRESDTRHRFWLLPYLCELCNRINQCSGEYRMCDCCGDWSVPQSSKAAACGGCMLHGRPHAVVVGKEVVLSQLLPKFMSRTVHVASVDEIFQHVPSKLCHMLELLVTYQPTTVTDGVDGAMIQLPKLGDFYSRVCIEGAYQAEIVVQDGQSSWKIPDATTVSMLQPLPVACYSTYALCVKGVDSKWLIGVGVQLGLVHLNTDAKRWLAPARVEGECGSVRFVMEHGSIRSVCTD